MTTVPSPRRVALLRAVNVGGRNKVPMAELRTAIGNAGFDDVATYIQSGNVVFRSGLSDAVASATVRETMSSSFGVETPVVIRSACQLADAVADHPWVPGEFDEKFHHVIFLADTPPPDAVELLADKATTEDVAVIGPDLHVRFRRGVAGTKLSMPLIDNRLATTATGRNLKTVRALAELAAG